MKLVVTSGIAVDISINRLLYSQGYSRKKEPAPVIISEAEKAVEKGLQLVEPAFALQKLPVEHAGEGVVCLDETRLKIGRHAHLLGPAEEAAAYVITAGSKLDEKVSELNRERKLEEAYWLDCAGVLALDSVFEEVCRVVEDMAGQKNFGVGASISPGTLEGWALQDQEKLCSLVGAGALGVHTRSSSLLVPYKSRTGLVGMGPGYGAGQVDYSCAYCSSRGNCWLSRLRRGVETG